MSDGLEISIGGHDEVAPRFIVERDGDGLSLSVANPLAQRFAVKRDDDALVLDALPVPTMRPTMYTIHIFTLGHEEPGYYDFVVNPRHYLSCDVLAVGGGGSGGGGLGGGGGGGGMLIERFNGIRGTNPVSVGAGGVHSGYHSASGGPSEVFGLYAAGGGGGGWSDQESDMSGGLPGGCGGGGAGWGMGLPANPYRTPGEGTQDNGVGYDELPALTGYSQYGFTVEASEESGSFYAWRAFDDANTDEADCWLMNASEGWLQVRMATPIVITGYTIATRAESADVYAPKSWTLRGSHDGETWYDLDTRSGVTWWANSNRAKSRFTFANDVAFAFYRLDITESCEPGWTAVGELELLNGRFAGGGNGGYGWREAWSSKHGGGGGGAGGDGAMADPGAHGNCSGGPGAMCNFAKTDTDLYYAGGGMGAFLLPWGGSGEPGIGGGGGVAHTGGGGNGGSDAFGGAAAGDGGSGIVIIRYAGPPKATGGTIESRAA